MEAPDLMTNVELAQLIKQMRDEISGRLNRIEAKLDHHEEYFAAIGLRFNQIDERFNQIDERLDQLTRPRRHATKTYTVLILEALVEMGGKGSAEEVKQQVKQKRGAGFKPHSVGSCRASMVREGLLQGDTRVWEITDKGRRALKTAQM